MSGKRGQWLSRRGQADADQAIDQVIEQRPQPGEQVQLLADDLIADSPYQARQSFSEESVEELAQGMREAGFQGVLIVRPHSDLQQRRRGIVQLVYGHRRRMAWRRVSAERSEACMIPVVVREISDQQLLTIGAQENLQRQDLDPVEEAQLVAWHQQMYFDKNQTEIGTLLGKSEDWVKTRSRIHKLPEPFKDRLRLRPRAISQMLELGAFYTREPEAALSLAEQVVQEQLTLDAVRTAVRNYIRPVIPSGDARDEKNNQRGTTPIVIERTNGDQSPHVVTRSALTSVDQTLVGETEQTNSFCPWLPGMLTRLSLTTGALRQVRGDLGALDEASATKLASAVEDLLRELDLTTRALGHQESS